MGCGASQPQAVAVTAEPKPQPQQQPAVDNAAAIQSQQAQLQRVQQQKEADAKAAEAAKAAAADQAQAQAQAAAAAQAQAQADAKAVQAAPAPAPAASTESSLQSSSAATGAKVALNVQFENTDPNAKENEAKENADGSDIDAHVEYGRARPVNPNDVLNSDELKAVGLRAADAKNPAAGSMFETEDASQDVSFGAVRPWLGAIRPPSKMPGLNSSAPTQNLRIDWVYGYRGYDSHGNVFLTSDGCVVYPTAALVIKYDLVNKTQTYFQGHNDDVICLAQCPLNPDLFASGQVATVQDKRAVAPHICIFNGKTMKPIATIQKAAQRAVRCLGISPAGKYLASVGDDNDFTLTVWDMKGNKLASLSADKDPNKVFGISWKNESEFVTVGVKHIFFWKFDGAKLTKTRGKCTGKFEMQTFFTATWTQGGHCAAATRDGGVYVFKNGEAAYAASGHTGAVYMVQGLKQGLLTGGRDGKVIFWDNTMQKKNQWNFNSPIRAFDVQDERMVVGTEHSELYAVNNWMGAASAPVCLFSGHWDGELWAIDSEPRGNGFATVGEDNKIILWDHREHKMLTSQRITDKPGKARKRERASTTSSFPANACARAIGYSPDGSHIAIGTNEGELAVYETKQLTPVAFHDLNKFAKQNISKKWGNWIQAIKYSPDGRYLAVGTHGSVIVLCDVARGYTPIELNTKQKALDGHNSALLQLDWSADGKFLRSNCRAYELLYWTVANPITESKQEGSATLTRDVQWASQSCPFSWATMGIFDSSQTGVDINAVDLHPEGTVLASSDNYGKVNLFRYPVIPPANYTVLPTNKAPAQQCDKKSFTGHSSHAQNVRWSPDGRYLFSVGGNDKTIIQWALA